MKLSLDQATISAMGKQVYHIKQGPSLGRTADVAINTTPGILIGASGAFLAVEGIISILFSQDQQTVSTVGRIARIGIGLSMMGWVASKS